MITDGRANFYNGTSSETVGVLEDLTFAFDGHGAGLI